MRNRLKELRNYIEYSDKFNVLLSTHHWFCFRYNSTIVEMWIIDAKPAVERLEYDISVANSEGFESYEKY